MAYYRGMNSRECWKECKQSTTLLTLLTEIQMTKYQLKPLSRQLNSTHAYMNAKKMVDVLVIKRRKKKTQRIGKFLIEIALQGDQHLACIIC